MSLKTDYRSDKFSGRRKYHIINNPDNTISLDDVTQYEQEGDTFTSDDVNTTNAAVNELNLSEENFKRDISKKVDSLATVVETITGEVLLTIPVSGWSGTQPYTQQIAFPGMRESDVPLYGLRLTGTLSDLTVENQKRAFGYIDRYASGDRKVTLYCYSKRPDTDVTVCVKGVGYG